MKTNKTICLDWLQCAYFGQLPHFEQNDNNHYRKINDNLFIKKSNRASRNYSQTAEIIYFGEPVAFVEYAPNKQTMNKELISIQIKNNLLYQKGYVDTMTEVTDLLKMSFQYVQKLDVAIDYRLKNKNLKKSFIADVARGIANDEIVSTGKAKFHPFYDTNNNIEGFHYGSRKSDKFLRGYYKHLEINESNKTYIRDFWKASGMNTSNGAYRMELSLKKNELIKYHEIKANELDLLENTEFLATLFKSAQNGFFEFTTRKELKSKKRADRCKKVFSLSFYNLGASLLDKASAVISDQQARIKMAAKCIYMIGEKTGNEIYQKLSRELAFNVGLTRWFDLRRTQWAQELNGWINNDRVNYLTKYEPLALGQMSIIKQNAYV